MQGLTKNIFHRLEWLWSLSDSLMIYSILIILILLTNINVTLIYFFTICEQKTKNYVHSGSTQHKTAAPIFLQLMFATFQSQSPLIYSLWKRVPFLPNWSIKGLKVGHRGGASTCKTLFWNSKYNCHWQLQIKKQLNHTFLTVSAKLCWVYCLLFRILFKDFLTSVFRQIFL